VSSILRKILPDVLDADLFAISDSRPADSFLLQCCVVSQLDESNKSPSSNVAGILRSQPSALAVAVVDRTADVSSAARSVALSRQFFRGQSHYAPDVVLVNEWIADEFLQHLVREIATPSSPSSSKVGPVANGHANGYATKPRPDLRAQSMKLYEGREGVKVIMSGDNGSVVEVATR
jgi:hypothetical protein